MCTLNLTDCHHDSAVETTCSYQEWFRLRECWNTILGLQKQLHSRSSQFGQLASETSSYRAHQSDLQNMNMRLKMLERQAAMAREFIRNLRYRLDAIGVENDNELLHDESDDLEEANLVGESSSSSEEEPIPEKRLHLRRLQNELIFRRRFMLNELVELFFPKITPSCTKMAFTKSCLCLKLDFIRGLHLPAVAARLGHNEHELCAATGLLVHLLQCTAAILAHPLKHSLQFNASRSMLITRASLESFKLFNLNSSKSSRDRFDHALYLLCEVVVQLRADCGIVGGIGTMDRPVRLLHELLLSCTGAYKFTQSELLAKPPSAKLPPQHLCPSTYITVERGGGEAAGTKRVASSEPVLYNYLLPQTLPVLDKF